MEPHKQLKSIAETYKQMKIDEMAIRKVKIPFTKRDLVIRTGADTKAAQAHLDKLHRRLWRDYNVGDDRNHKVFDPNHHDPEIAEILGREKKRIEREGI
jgi:hypothetical protein